MISDELQREIDEHVAATISTWRKPDEQDVTALRRVLGPALRRTRERPRRRAS